MPQVHKPASVDNNRADIIFLREYEFGVMSNETVLRMADKDAQRKAIKKDKSVHLPGLILMLTVSIYHALHACLVCNCSQSAHYLE